MIKILFFIAIFPLVATNNSMTVRDSSGKMVARIYKNGDVRDPSGTLLGTVRNSGTYDKSGRKLLDQELPGYLIPRR